MWLLPSFDRPEKAKALAESHSEVPFTLWLTEDAPQLDKYLGYAWPARWEVVVGPAGLRTAAIWNEAFRRYPDEDFYGFVGDDVQIETPEWHIKLEDAARNRFISYPKDSIHGGNLCPHMCIGGDLVRAVGWWALPGLTHSFVDTTWHSIGRILGLGRYVSEVEFLHMHPIAGKAEMDETYRRGQESYEHDELVFTTWWKKEARGLLLQLARKYRGDLYSAS